MKRLSLTSLLFAWTLPLISGCEKDEAPPPLPAAPTAAAPAPQTDLVVEEEALPEEDTGPAKTGTGRPAASLRACCSALHKGAANAPPPNDGYMKTAAAMCDGMVAAGQTAGATAALQAALRGAGLPSSCR